MSRRHDGELDDLIRYLWEAGGSDLLVTAGAPPLVRVDGELLPVPDRPVVDAERAETIIRGALTADLQTRLDRDHQVDFSLTWGDVARVRGNAFRQRQTLALALRAIPLRIPTWEELGLPPVIAEWAGLRQGLVLVVGATGSGKSTTLASIVDHINTHRHVHVLTVEDPIEYVHVHRRAAVTQREVGTDAHSFPDALRAALREDPDVLLVGEMRDLDSIRTALTFAETGHLVLATLHANDTSQAIDRIVDVFPADQQPQIRLQFANTLAGVLYQQLVPRVGGGRAAAVELLVGTYAVRNLVREGKSRQIRNLLVTGQREGMRTLEMSLSELVAKGLVSHTEAVARSNYPAEIAAPSPQTEVIPLPAT